MTMKGKEILNKEKKCSTLECPKGCDVIKTSYIIEDGKFRFYCPLCKEYYYGTTVVEVEKIKVCKGECPECGSKDIEWEEVTDTDNSTMIDEGFCNSCETRFVQVFEVKYINTRYSKIIFPEIKKVKI